MANIQGINNLLPGSYSSVQTVGGGVAIPGGSRIAVIIGEGSTDQVLISTAVGGGSDGLDPTYTTNTGSDGRHFIIANAPLVSNRTSLYKNGILLTGLETTVNAIAPYTFSSTYDYELDISTGQVLLQGASLVNQGGNNYATLSTNVGIGVVNNLTLIDSNAISETWSLRCIGVQRDPSNNPIAATAKFIAVGSISGSLVNANGSPYIWIANDTVVSNGVISFSIVESKIANVVTNPFVQGDGFTVMIKSGILNKGDSLTSNSIPVSFINDPVTFTGFKNVIARHGNPSFVSQVSGNAANGTNNNLSLGAQLLFSNSAPAVITCQAAPPMPRRQSYTLSSAVPAYSTTAPNYNDFIFPLPINVTPDANSEIHFFTIAPSTSVETQILPNKFTFDTLDVGSNPSTHAFIADTVAAPTGNSYSYSVNSSFETINTGLDGYIGRNPSYTTKGLFESSIIFTSNYVGKLLNITDSVNSANSGTYTIDSVSGGNLYVTHTTDIITFANGESIPANTIGFPNFVSESTLSFQLVNPVTLLDDGYSGSDGVVASTSGPNPSVGSFHSTSLTFSTVPSLLSQKLQITNSVDGNKGLYDITAYDSGSNTLTIQKSVVNETGMRYEILDPTVTSQYVVINRNVVSPGYGLRATIVDSKEASFYDAGWVNALASLETIECDIVVPLPTATPSVIFQNTVSHCAAMSNTLNRKERIPFIGAINGLIPDNLTGAKLAVVESLGVLEGIVGSNPTEVLADNPEDLANYSVSAAYGDTYRCVYLAPDQIVVNVSGNNTVIDGFYMAAGLAGYLSANLLIQEPITNKVISGFTIQRNRQYSTLDLMNLQAAGVTTLQPVSGGGLIISGVTTTQSGFPEEIEPHVIFIRDRIAKAMRGGYAGFIGQPAGQNTGALLNTTGIQMLNSFVSNNWITTYSNLSVIQDSVDPRQWNVNVMVSPNFGIKWVYITVGVTSL